MRAIQPDRPKFCVCFRLFIDISPFFGFLRKQYGVESDPILACVQTFGFAEDFSEVIFLHKGLASILYQFSKSAQFSLYFVSVSESVNPPGH